VDLYFYTIAKVPDTVEDGEWISASSLPAEEPIFAFPKVVDNTDSIRIFVNGYSSESLEFEGGLDALDSFISGKLLSLVKAAIGSLPQGSESGLNQIICIQDDADYDLDEQWEFSLGQDEIACPSGASCQLLVSVTPYYSAEVASTLDIAVRPPKLTNAAESICEEHMLVAIFLG
jgi:hypothetical protein